MLSRRNLDLAALVAALAGSRFVFRSRYLYDLDSVNFALALRRFDPSVHQPHPPGYFLYVWMGRLLNLVFHDANLSLVLLSIGASCGAGIVIYRMALAWFGLAEARFAALVFLFSPLAWFHGTVALTYSVEAFFSALTGYLCWRMVEGSAGSAWAAGFVLGLSAGVRPSSLVLLAPLFLFSLRKAPKGAKSAAAALLLTIAAWFPAMLAASGGWRRYFDALLSLWRVVPSRTTVFNSSPANSIARALTILLIALLFAGVSALAPLAAVGRSCAGDPGKKSFTLFWTAPALCFFTFVYLKFVNSGYLLLLAAPFCLWLGRWLALWHTGNRWPRAAKVAILAAGAAVNSAIFLAAPFYCSYRSVRRFEGQLGRIRAALPRVAGADDTLIVGFDSHFLGYRHAGYYLPGYLTLQYPEVNLVGGARVFAMQDGQTRLLASLPLDRYRRFVFFPLPGGKADYRQYLEQVESKLPGGVLRVSQAGGYAFVTGPVSILPLLFPETAPKPAAGVYMALHPEHPAVNNRAHSIDPERP